MKRLAVSFVVLTALLVCFGADRTLGEDYVCPPGAKFCPAPGSDGQAALPMDAPFGLDNSNMYASAAPAGGMTDFMPPPPGSPRPAQPAPAAQTPRRPAPAVAPAPAPSARPVREQRNVAVAERRPAPAKASADRGGAPSERQARSAGVAKKPAKKKADMLSEVANETSRKSKSGRKADKADSKKSDRDARDSRDKKKNAGDRKKKSGKSKKKSTGGDDRIPWWKGGLWRN